MITAVKLFCIFDTSLPPARPLSLHCAVLPLGKSIRTNFWKFIILIDSILTFKNNSFLSISSKNEFPKPFSPFNPKKNPFH